MNSPHLLAAAETFPSAPDEFANNWPWLAIAIVIVGVVGPIIVRAIARAVLLSSPTTGSPSSPAKKLDQASEVRLGRVTRAAWLLSLAAIVASLWLVVAPGWQGVDKRNEAAVASWEADAATWAETRYGVTAGTRDLLEAGEGEPSTVIVGGQLVDVTLKRIGDQAVLLLAEPAKGEGPTELTRVDAHADTDGEAR